MTQMVSLIVLSSTTLRVLDLLHAKTTSTSHILGSVVSFGAADSVAGVSARQSNPSQLPKVFDLPSWNCT